MKNQSSPNKATYFTIKFSKTILVLAVAVLCLCVASIIVSILNMKRFGLNGFSDYLKYPFLLLVSVFCIAIVVALLIKSQYIIDETYFISQYGFIKSRYEIEKITSIVLDTDTNKLTVYMGEEFFVLSLNKEWNEKFVRALLNVKPSIDYSFTVAEKNDTEEK